MKPILGLAVITFALSGCDSGAGRTDRGASTDGGPTPGDSGRGDGAAPSADAPPSAPSGAPLIFYTDLASAPAGAYVTVWGRGFGAAQGSSTVTHGGAAVAKVVGWTDRMIELRLAAAAKSGDLVVTTAAGSSPPLPLLVHAGKLYFVSALGNDAWSGTLESPAGTDGPFKSLAKGRDALAAGDVLYLRAGTFLDEDNYNAILSLRDIPTGTAAAPVAIVGYPGETATLGDNTIQRSISLYRGDNGPPLDYLTIAKLHLKPSCFAIAIGTGDYGRIVGNEFSGATDACMEGVINATGSTGWKILGNYIHDNGNTKFEHGIYLGGYGTEKDFEIAFNRIEKQKGGRGIQLYGHQTTDTIQQVSIHDNEIFDIDRDGIVLGNTDGDVLYLQDIQIYNNLFHRAGRCVGAGVRVGNATAKGIAILHNTFVDNGAGNTSCDQSGGEPGSQIFIEDAAAVDLRNNLMVAQGSEEYVDLAMTPASFTGSNNFFSGSAAAPAWDKAATSGDPMLQDAANRDFHLEAGSPAAGKGAAAGIKVDHDGIARPAAPAIGAYEPSK